MVACESFHRPVWTHLCLCSEQRGSPGGDPGGDPGKHLCRAGLSCRSVRRGSVPFGEEGLSLLRCAHLRPLTLS